MNWYGSSLPYPEGGLALAHNAPRYAHWFCVTSQGFYIVSAASRFEACVRAEQDAVDLLAAPKRSWSTEYDPNPIDERGKENVTR